MKLNDRSYGNLLAELLSLICTFEQKIELSKQQLAGYSEFDARTAFCSIDKELKGYIDARDLRVVLAKLGNGDGVVWEQFGWFLKRYGTKNRLSYEEFLLLILPKNSPSLAQSLMVRNPIGARLPQYLQERFDILVGYYLIMTIQSQGMKQLLYQQYGLNIIQLHNKIGKLINSQQGLFVFISNNGYEVDRTYMKYLSNHVSRKVTLKDFNENQYRQIFSPINSIYQTYIQPLSIPSTTRNRTPPKITSATRKSFNDSFYQKSKDNYLNIKFNTTRNAGLFTNRTFQQNQNANVNLLPLMRNIGSMQSFHSGQKLNYSPIPKQSVRNFQSINIPGITQNYLSQKNISLPSHNQILNKVIVPIVVQASNQSLFPPSNQPIFKSKQDQTFLIDKFIKCNPGSESNIISLGNISPPKRNKEVFLDDLQQSQHNAFQYY